MPRRYPGLDGGLRSGYTPSPTDPTHVGDGRAAAQLGERLGRIEEVVGSIPIGSIARQPSSPHRRAKRVFFRPAEQEAAEVEIAITPWSITSCTGRLSPQAVGAAALEDQFSGWIPVASFVSSHVTSDEGCAIPPPLD